MMMMFAIFMLIRNFMGGLSKPAQQESPASIIANYNQSLKTPEPENTVDMSNPITGMLGLMKGMMPVKMGEKDITYIPSLKEGDLCVRFGMVSHRSPFTYTHRKKRISATLLPSL